MISWRDSASRQAQEDLDGLLDPALGFAQQQLARYGEFYPFVLAIAANGQTEMIHLPRAEGSKPRSADVIIAGRVALSDRRDDLRAAAIVTDVRMPDRSDAIQVQLEHAEGTALVITLPYSRQPVERNLRYGDLRAAAGYPIIW